MINWINSWRSGSKKEIYEIKFRLGMLTVFQVNFVCVAVVILNNVLDLDLCY